MRWLFRRLFRERVHLCDRSMALAPVDAPLWQNTIDIVFFDNMSMSHDAGDDSLGPGREPELRRNERRQAAIYLR
ncbi:hypothetical protein ASD86_09810 [Lysobacter sp. Root690]|nr:hypothetical protein ASD86_09810 [Lysobacter sp. Root690]